MANSHHSIVIAVTYVAILTALVFFKFNLIYPTTENEFVFSGDFVRPITVDAAHAYYLRPFVLSDYTASMDVTAPVRIAYWTLVLTFTQIMPLNLVYWFLIVGTHIAGASLVALSCSKLLHGSTHVSNAMRYILPLIPSILFLFSYPVNYRPYWLFLPLLPAILCYVLTTNYSVQERTRKLLYSEKGILIGLGYISVLQPHLYVIITGAMILVIGLEVVVKKIHRLQIRATIGTSMQSLFWYSIPFMLILIPIAALQSIYDVEIAPDYAYNLDILRMMSQNSDLTSVLTFSNGFWEKVVFSDVEIAVMLFVVCATLVLFTIQGSKRKVDRPITVAVVVTFAIAISFALGYHNPIYRLIADPDFSQSWIFRDPFKMSLGALGILLFALSVTMAKLSHSMVWFGRKLATFGREGVIIAIAILVILWDPVQKTADTMAPSVVPDTYFVAANHLKEGDIGPTVFLPDSGSKYEWTENTNLQTQFLAMTNLDRSSGTSITQNPRAREFVTYALQTGDTDTLGLATQSIILDNSLASTKYEQLKDAMISNSSVSLTGHLYYVENNNFKDVRIHQGEPIYHVGAVDYRIMKELKPFEVPVVFVDPNYTILESSGTGLVALNPKGGDPSKGWVKGYSHDPLHGEWHHYLDKNRIENWQSDYDEGIAFTSAPKLFENSAVSEADIMTSWQFDSEEDITSWKTVTPEKQAGALHVLGENDGTLQITLWNSTQGWKVIRSPMMQVDPSHSYKITLEAKGENTLRVHTKLVEYDSQNQVVLSKNLNVLGNGHFDWKEATYQYTPSSDSVSQVQLQIWHGHESDKPLPNKIWLDNVRIYDLTRHFAYPSLASTFDIRTAGAYTVYIRYLQSPAGGQLILHVDNQTYHLNSKGDLTTFVWERLQLAPLKTGEHQLILESVDGFNAVNLVGVVPATNFDSFSRSSQFEGKTLLTILPSGSALYYENATLAESHINQEVGLRYDSAGRSWQDIEILRDDRYVIAVRGTGNFEGTIDGNYFELERDGNTAYSQLLDLTTGKYRVEIRGNEGSLLESIWVYSADAGSAIDDLLTANTSSSRIISYERINPVTWNLSISSEEPSTITVAQYHDPQWEARVYVNDKLVETAQPIQLYGLLTGFKINSTGENLKIILQYRVQEGFNIAMIISLVGFVALISSQIFSVVWKRYALRAKMNAPQNENGEILINLEKSREEKRL